MAFLKTHSSINTFWNRYAWMIWCLEFASKWPGVGACVGEQIRYRAVCELVIEKLGGGRTGLRHALYHCGWMLPSQTHVSIHPQTSNNVGVPHHRLRYVREYYAALKTTVSNHHFSHLLHFCFYIWWRRRYAWSWFLNNSESNNSNLSKTHDTSGLREGKLIIKNGRTQIGYNSYLVGSRARLRKRGGWLWRRAPERWILSLWKACHGNKVTPSRRRVTAEKKIDVYTNRVKESQCGHKTWTLSQPGRNTENLFSECWVSERKK